MRAVEVKGASHAPPATLLRQHLPIGDDEITVSERAERELLHITVISINV